MMERLVVSGLAMASGNDGALDGRGEVFVVFGGVGFGLGVEFGFFGGEGVVEGL